MLAGWGVESAMREPNPKKPAIGAWWAIVVILAVVVSLLTVTRRNALDHGSTDKSIITGRVVKIADGDTLVVLDGSNAQHRIRLFGIDAPEHGQAFGTKARENLAGKVFDKVVRVDVVDRDQYGRSVGRLYLDDRYINMEMVRDGYAWRYTHFDKSGAFITAEREAHVARRGLWADKNPTPPWEFRREERQEKKDRTEKKERT